MSCPRHVIIKDVKRTNTRALRVASTVAACLAADAMAYITIMAERTPSVFAFWLALPGIFCHFLITVLTRGNHTGEMAGFTSAVLINSTLAATPFLLGIFRTGRPRPFGKIAVKPPYLATRSFQGE